MVILGERLKKARENAGLTLKKFSDSSKIAIKYIKYLEEGQYEKLPASVYIRGFFKKYEQILNLSAEELFKEYLAELEAKPIVQKPIQLKSSPKKRVLNITPKKIRWVIVIASAILVVGYLSYQFDFLRFYQKI